MLRKLAAMLRKVRGRPSQFPSDTQTNDNLSLLRLKTQGSALANDVVLAPGVELHADPAMGVSGTYRSPPGRLLEIDAQAGHAGDWFGLHISLSARDLSDSAVLGFVARTQAPQAVMIRAALRTGSENGTFTDIFFDKHILMHSEVTTHLDALSLPARLDVPAKADWRELILFLPPETIRLSLIDLRVFIL